MKASFLFSGALLLITNVSTSFGASYTIDASNRGHYQSTGGRLDGNYIAGNTTPNEYYHNYFVFDLSLIPTSETITSATLRLFNPSAGFRGSDPTETYTNFSLDNTSIAVLINGNGSTASNVPIYNDLGDGTAYSLGTVVSTASNGTFVQVLLNRAFLNYAQSNLGSSVALGGAITTLDNDGNTVEDVFGGTNGSVSSDTQIIINTVPEPATGFFLVAGIGLLAFAGYTRGTTKREDVQQ